MAKARAAVLLMKKLLVFIPKAEHSRNMLASGS
jgi:hypothetical protein